MKKILYDLTNPQKSIWYTEQFYQGSPVNNLCGTLFIHQKVDFSLLKKALYQFVKDNDAFRINLEYDEKGEIKQSFKDFEQFDIDLLDLNSKEDICTLEKKLVTTPFSILNSDLHRFVMFRFPNGEGGFVLVAHHLIFDACTSTLVASKVMNIYSDFLKSKDSSEVPTSYINYIKSEEEYINSSKFEKDKTYWNSIFETVPEIGTIASVKQEKGTSCKAKRKTFVIPKEKMEKINSFCSFYKISSFNFFMALYAIYIGRISNLNDFVLGTPILNRSTFEQKNTAGMFISTIPFRFTIRDSQTFVDFVKQIAFDSLGMFRHQKYPYQYILEDIRKKNPSQPNLYDILISYQNTKTNRNELEIPYNVRWAFNHNVVDSMQIHLFDINDDGVLNISYDYRLDKYDEKDICAIHDRICFMMEQVLEDSSFIIRDIDVVTPRERTMLLEEFNNTTLSYAKEKTVVDFFEEQVEKTPDAIALVCNDRTYSYKKLNEEANKLANYLIKLNIKPKDKIGVLLYRSPEMIIGLLAILKVGATYLPIDPEYPIERISYMLQDSECQTILVHKDTSNLIKNNITKIDISLSSTIYTSTKIQNLKVSILPDSLIYMIYTSGSTGNPKGVMLTHQNINNFILGVKNLISFSPSKVMVSVTTICFDIFALEIWCSLTSGTKLVLANDKEQMSPILLKELCLKHNVNMIQTTPSRFSTLLADSSNSDFLNNFTDIMVGGEPFPKILLEGLKRYTKANIFNMYGPTETTVWSTIKDLTNTSNITIGKPIANTTCYILDKNKMLLPPYVAGELYIGGDGVSTGYWKREDLTNEKFILSPFRENETIYNTNDLAYFTDKGELVHLGRTDFQVKIRGYRVELEEIENKIVKFPAILNCVVNPINNASKLCAYYVSKEKIDINNLRNYLARELPNYMVPNYFVKMDTFPYTPNGKINKKALPLPESTNKKEIVAPKTEFEKFLVTELKNSLALDNISITDSFFEIGGDSLSAINLCSKIANTYNIEFMVKDIFANPIIQDIATNISSRNTLAILNPLTFVEEKPFYHVSSAQKRVYYTSKMAGENSTLYNMPGAIIFNKVPDVKKLEECFKFLIKKHSSLCTYFEIIDNEVYQKLDANVSFTLEKSLNETSTIEEVIENFVKPFNLARAPLFRAELVTLKDKNILLFDMHHIISDGLSLSILTTELCKLYNGEDLSSPSIQYVDYAEWEYNNLKENKLESSKTFWLEQFNKEIPVLNMPTDFARPAIQSFEGAKVYQTIPETLTKKIDSLAKKLNVSNYMLLLACYYILLYKYTNQEDLVVGSPVIGRNKEELLNIIGMFVNTLPLKTHIDSNISFNKFLENVKANCMEALSNQIFPFDELVNNLKLSRDTSRSPLFDTMFTYQNDGMAPLHFNEIEANYYIPDTKIAKFDLSLEVIPTKDELQLNFEYCTKLFKKETIERFSNHFIHILENIVDNYDLKISDISILSEEEKNKILYEFNDTKMEYPRDKTIIELFEEQVEKTPNNIAVVFEEQKLTYRELNEKANNLAWYLKNKNVSNGDIVCMLFDKSLEMIVSILSILKLGACYLPIDINYPEDRIKYIINDSQSNIVLTTNSIIRTLPFVNTYVCVDLDNNNIYGNSSFSIKIDNTNAKDIAYIMYTSGSTGGPKGVMVNNRNVVRLVKNTNFIEFSNNERILQTGSIVFDACTFEIWGALLNGFELYIIKKEELLDSSLLQDYLLKYKITILWLTAPLFNQLCEDNPHMFNNVKYLLTGGDVLSPKHINMVRTANPNLKIINGYGPTENTTFSTCFTIDKTYEDNIPIGRPIANSTAYVVSPTGSLLPIGFSGELWVGGDGVANGYFNNQELTQEKFIKNPFGNGILYKTGDLVKWLPNGNIEFIGRIDNQVKIRGFRVELNEINNKISNFNNIKECTTIICDIKNEKTICSYFVSKTDDIIDENSLKEYLRKYLPNYMIPTYFYQLDKLPINANGKIDRKALPTNFNLKVNIEIIEPTNETESILLEIYKKILDINEIGIKHNFFEVGGDSLTAMKVQLECVKHNLNVTYSDIFKFPTIELLAKNINSTFSNFNTIEKCSARKFYPTSSAQKRMYLSSSIEQNSTLYNVTGGILLDTMPDISKLENALKVIVDRHSSLRTYFEVIDGNIVQKVLDNIEISIEKETVNTNNVDDLLHEYQSVFTLNKAPLFKVYLLTLPNKKVLLVLDVHHIIFDGASLNNFIQEVSTLYNGKELPKLPISYTDFAVWEEEQLLENGFKESKEFWLKQFENDIPILNMPTTYARPANKSYDGTTFVTSISKDTTLKIEQFANKYNVTPYMVMLSAYYILLYKYTNQEDIVIGSPISGRFHQELEPLLGMFVNSIPIKSSILATNNIEEFLQQIKETCVNAFAHQDFPFDVLVNELNIPKDNSRNPLFDTMFIYQNKGFSNLNFDKINAQYCIPTSNTSKFDLSVEVLPTNNELTLSFEYCTKLFNEDFINQFATHYCNILNAILEQPKETIANISILSKEEREKILIEFNNTQMDYEKNKTIANLFEEQVQKTPTHTALVFEDSKLTYNELNEKANQLAHYLHQQGIKEGSTVGIMLPRSLEVLVAILGVLKAGACYIPIDPTLPTNRINYMLNNSNTDLLLIKKSLPSEITIEHTLDVNLNNTTIYCGNCTNLTLSISPDSPSYMIYTSGSTGTPKGVVLKHKALTNLATYLTNTVEFLHDEYLNIAIASITTISFDIFIFETLICLQRGLKIVIANEAEQNTPNLLDELIVKNNVKAIQMTPSRMYIFINNLNLMPHLHELNFVVLAGEALPKDLLNRILELGNIKVYNGYGPSETTVFSTFTDVTNYEEVTIGKPLANTRIYILDKNKNICPIGNAGEIFIAGDGVGIGYCNMEELTKERFVPDIFYPNETMYQTGDLAKYLPNGEIHYIGRVDNQIKIRGLRIELDEIENCILKYPNVEKCVIMADSDTNHRQFIVAYLTVSDRISVNKLRMFLKTLLPKYMVPSYFMVLDKFPYLNNGKINKKALPKPEISNSMAERTPYVAPRDKLEFQIATIFQNLLSISPIGIDDSFFELGGDSLLAINLQVELLKLHLNITYSDIFMHPTIRELARKISLKENTTFSTIDANEFEDFNKILDSTCTLPKTFEKDEIGNIFITGCTGFLGAHVLDAFLRKEKGTAYCLIRKEPGLTLENKLVKKLRFYFGNKYDRYIGDRIVIINADITKNNLGLSNEEIEKISNRVSCVINCAAKVSHYGNYSDYKDVNVTGTENLLKFCYQFNKRFYQVSTLSVSGNSLVDQSYIEQSFEEDVIYRENNFYINQALDNVYVRSKFEAEKLVLQYILKGLDGYIFRVGNLMSRFSDGKFQPNVDENAYVGRLLSLLNIGCIPDYMLNAYMEFTPIDSCAEAIIKLIHYSNKLNRIFHLYDHNHVDVIDFINILKKYVPFDIISHEEFIKKINSLTEQENSNQILSGILRDFDSDQKLVYESKVKLKSEFTIEYLAKIGFEWPIIDNTYLTRFLDYFALIGYIKKEKEEK